ncbi:hypothetical protein ONZ45_g326 [Pleurotus djamor]|nr:hypothetical protein ONZ45_g326 [Pleurotus djamor]
MPLDLELVEVTPTGLAYICLGGFVVVFSMFSLLVREKLYISEVVLGTGFGILIGPLVANAFDPRSWGNVSNAITLEVMRVVLGTGLFAIGIELPQTYMLDHVKGLSVMVIPTMALGWVTVAGIMDALFPQLNFISCLVIAACLTPTDPVICATIVGGKYAIKHVPENLRHILAAESAANDGLAYPFLSISIYLTVEASRRVAIAKWFLVGWLYQVIMGIVIGAIIGFSFSRLMKFAHVRGYIDRESYVAQYLAVAIFTIGVVRTIGSDDLLAAFAAGCAISWDGHFNAQVEGEVFASVIDLVLNCACFVYIGAWIPFQSFNIPQLGVTPWELTVLSIAILCLRRIPFVLMLYSWTPEIISWKEAIFCGHFGPMGVGAIFVSTLALTRLPEPQDPPQGQAELLAVVIHPIVSFVVLVSIIIHGLSIPFFSLGRRATRTLSISTTFTRSNGPDWLIWTRRMPHQSTSVPDVANVCLENGERGANASLDLDIESGNITRVPSKTHPASQVTATTSQQDVTQRTSSATAEQGQGGLEAHISQELTGNKPESQEAKVEIKTVRFPPSE